MSEVEITHVYCKFCACKTFYKTTIENVKNLKPKHRMDFNRFQCYFVKWHEDLYYYRAQMCCLGGKVKF